MYAPYVADGASITLNVCRNAEIIRLLAWITEIWILVAGNLSGNVYI
jgi:hypothetical protein